MGYTHYWRTHRDFTEEEWFEIRIAAVAMFNFVEEPIVAGWNGKGKPEADENRISFNGVGDYDSHESMVLTRVREGKPEWMSQAEYDDHGEFNCCKTAYKPYDKIVVKLLKLVKKIAPDAITLSSDGDVFEDVA